MPKPLTFPHALLENELLGSHHEGPLLLSALCPQEEQHSEEPGPAGLLQRSKGLFLHLPSGAWAVFFFYLGNQQEYQAVSQLN